jgi:hypothetical protein
LSHQNVIIKRELVFRNRIIKVDYYYNTVGDVTEDASVLGASVMFKVVFTIEGADGFVFVFVTSGGV